jgi:hypothetical protein
MHAEIFYVGFSLLLVSLLVWMLIEIRKGKQAAYIPARIKSEPIVVFNGVSTMKMKKYEK